MVIVDGIRGCSIVGCATHCYGASSGFLDGTCHGASNKRLDL